MDSTLLLSGLDIAARRMKHVNLIASENRLSPLARRFLATESSSRYYFQGDDMPFFPGGLEYAPILHLGEQLLKQLGRAHHVSMRPLSGLNAMTVLILALTNPGETVVSISVHSGGHWATQPITQRVGRLHADFLIPIDGRSPYTDLESVLLRHQPRLLYLDQCHGLCPIDLSEVARIVHFVSPHTHIHADVSHGLGLVFGGVIANPLEAGCHSYGGSTHKTFPGPQKAVVLTNDDDVAALVIAAQGELISNHHVAEALALSVALWEFSECDGLRYAASIPMLANKLGEELAVRNIMPIRIGKSYSRWHQLWIGPDSLPIEPTECGVRLSEAGIMVNVLPDLPGISPYGLRLGVSEIAHLGFTEPQVIELADLIHDILVSSKPAATFLPGTADLVRRSNCPYDFRE